MNAFTELVILRFRDRNEDTVVDVVAKRLNVLPAQNHLQIYFFGGLRDEIGAPQHREKIEETQVPKDLDCLLVDWSKMWWNFRE